MVKTLISGAIVVTCDAQQTVHDPGDIVFEDDRITWVGPRYDDEYDMRVLGAGRLLMPGLINAHTHSSMTLFRSLADDVDLMVFLEQRVWPRELRLGPDEAYAGAALAGVEMLKSGVTTYVDMYFFPEDVARAALDVGLRALVTPGILESPAWRQKLGSWEEQTRRILGFCREWEGREGRIHTGLGPHAPYTVPIPAMGEIAGEARKAKLPVHTHLLETKGERDIFENETTGGEVGALQDVGFFEGDIIAAHSVWVDARDIDIYAQHRVGVAHCPQSNMKLGSGIAPVADMLAANLQVGLGTDGAATNNNLDLWEELRTAPLLAKVHALNPTLVTAKQALAMATSMAAAAIHRPDVGVLQPGCKADILMVDIDDSTAIPIFDSSTYVDHLVYAMGRELVRSVWVNGRQVVKDRELLTVDEASLRRNAQQAAMALSAKVGQ